MSAPLTVAELITVVADETSPLEKRISSAEVIASLLRGQRPPAQPFMWSRIGYESAPAVSPPVRKGVKAR